MRRFDKETMEEINEAKKNIDEAGHVVWYGIKKILVKVVLVILIISTIGGAMGMAHRYIAANANRRIFKQTITYNEGVLDDLAKYKFEYDTAEDNVERNAIASLVRERFANYDKSKIENEDLTKFLKECGL